jgi:benzoyl-CoA reductase/2-hydroxyglutaryl-CoA dehydratase subunit BcrC/BadD/HgdB
MKTKERNGMSDTLDAIREMRAMNEAPVVGEEWRTPALLKWKEDGGKIVAFQCAYVPEELLHAAGILSVRLHGGETKEVDLEEANAQMYPNTCSYIRSCAALVLDKKYDFLDGFIAGSTCDPSRRLWDLWDHYDWTPFHHVMSIPRKNDEKAHQRFLLDVRELKSRVEAFFKVEITDEALWKSIKVFNRTRELFARLHEMKKKDAPPVTGAETQEIYNAMSKMPREQFNALLERIVVEAESGKRAVKGKYRLMISGSPLNNPLFIKVFEDQGAVVVVDELCTGTRYWWTSVEEKKYSSPIEALSRRYLDNQPCARMMPSEERFEKVLQVAEEYRVDGFVSEVMHFCVPYAHDQPFLSLKLKENRFPVLELDVEYGVGATGQVTTRAQAFLEMLRKREKVA